MNRRGFLGALLAVPAAAALAVREFFPPDAQACLSEIDVTSCAKPLAPTLDPFRGNPLTSERFPVMLREKPYQT